jgi:hypothetical protein
VNSDVDLLAVIETCGQGIGVDRLESAVVDVERRRPGPRRPIILAQRNELSCT